MVEAQPFVTELESKHQDTIRRLVDEYLGALAKESLQVVDVIKLEMKAVIEAIEVAALWLADSETLEAKLAMASRCGDGARQYGQLSNRLTALDTPPGSFDPRHAGYSKLFAFFRSLTTVEERAAAGGITLRTVNIARLTALAAWCNERGDLETAQLLGETLVADERARLEAGRKTLVGIADTEEIQARARRSSYRTLELVAEIQDPMMIRKFLIRSRR